MSQQQQHNNKTTLLLNEDGSFPTFTTTTSSASSSSSSSERTLLVSNRSKSIEPIARLLSSSSASSSSSSLRSKSAEPSRTTNKKLNVVTARGIFQPATMMRLPVTQEEEEEVAVTINHHAHKMNNNSNDSSSSGSSTDDEESNTNNSDRRSKQRNSNNLHHQSQPTSSSSSVALWTAFGQEEDDDSTRLPTISPPTLPIVLDHHHHHHHHNTLSPTSNKNNFSKNHRYHNHISHDDDDYRYEVGQEEPTSPTATNTTTATETSDHSSNHFMSNATTTSFTASPPAPTEEYRRLQALSKQALTDKNLDPLLAHPNEDSLLALVAQINSLYEHTLHKDAPFMTFVLCGIQSAGKSYLIERFMNAVINIVDDGTATRCPLDITCLHHSDLEEPLCDLEGLECTTPGMNLSIQEVFERVTLHNRRLESEQRVSIKPLHLIYRARNVQNMRLVDTPGMKMNQDNHARDDRTAIADIIRNEMHNKPNATLCLLLQSTEEFATQPIVRFCDDTFGHRAKWIGRAIFLMTKSDLLICNKKTAQEANKFFAKFHEQHCFPHLIITPTVSHLLSSSSSSIQTEALYKARTALLETADAVEAKAFDQWLADHERYNNNNNLGISTSANMNPSIQTTTTTTLNEEVKLRIGFASAKKVMRNIMLDDTRKRLPEVLVELRGQMETLQKQRDNLEYRQKLRDPDQLKPLAMQALRQIEDRVSKYINGNLNACRNFPERMQSLGEEIQDEAFSEWSSRKLNHHKETQWRQRIETLHNQFPSYVQPNKAFLGGKQIQRAIEFFRAVMVDSLPDPQGEFRDLVANSVGYLANGTLRENWEQALVQIVETCVKEMTHPGINYVVKHVGYICRRLFRLAMDDIKQDDRFYDAFKVLPVAVEKHFMMKFDTMLWGLMEKSADRISMALEPMYSTIDPSISNFPSLSANMPNPEVRQGPGDREESDSSITSGSRSVKDRIQSMKTLSADGVKNVVKRVAEARAIGKTSFLPEAKSSMITDDEADKILMKSFQYIVTLLEFNLVNLRFQMNHHLVIGFKETLRGPFVDDIILNTNWNELIERDYALDDHMKEVENQLAGVKASLDGVKRLMD